MKRCFIFVVLVCSSALHAAVDYDIFMITPEVSGGKLLRVDESTGVTLAQIPLPPNFRPARIVPDPSGDGTVWINSISDNRVVRLKAMTGEVVTSFAFTNPLRIAVSPTSVFITTSTPTNAIHRYALDGSAANVGAFPLSSAGFTLEVEITPAGKLLTNTGTFREFDPDTGAQTPFAITGGPIGFTGGFVTFNPAGDQLFITKDTVINRFSAAGAFDGTFATGMSGIGGSQGSGPIHFGPDGHLYAANVFSNIIKFNGATGAQMASWPANVSHFAFVPVPEPSAAAAGLLIVSAALRRHRRWTSCSKKHF